MLPRLRRKLFVAQGLGRPLAGGALALLLALYGAGDTLAQSASTNVSQPPVSGPAAASPIKKPMTKQAVTYAPVTFADLPGWETDDHLAALKAFLASCPRVTRPGIKLASDKIAPADVGAICEAALRLPAKISRADAKAFFEQNFTPSRVVHQSAEGLLTGYYEPVIRGSRTPNARFKTPVFRRPTDLVNLVDESQRGARADQPTHARKVGDVISPYPTRQEIELGALAGQGLELLYLEDPVEVFFTQVQGSARVQFEDGTSIRITYDGKNGHPYTSIGRYLIDKGLIEENKASLATIGAWLRADLERARAVMWQNASYVFFRELSGPEADSAMGVMSIPLMSGRSLAVDAGHHVIGLPVYVSSRALSHATKSGGFHRLMVAHDVGSAIRGPERGDIYFGSGDAAGKLAGITKHPGNLFVLVPRLVPANPGVIEAREAAPAKTRAAQQ